MAEPHILLTTLGTNFNGLSWQSKNRLRIGRSTHLDIVFPDCSVDRVHAEIKYEGSRWILRDLAQTPLYPTLLNHMRVIGKDHLLNVHDIIQIGNVRLKVVQLTTDAIEEPVRTDRPKSHQEPIKELIQATEMQVQVQATMQNAWDKALENQNALVPLVRANYHLTHLSDLDELFRSILSDATTGLQAQRGTIILADANTGALTFRATLAPNLRGKSKVQPFNKALAERCFERGESLLCRQAEAEEEVMTRSYRYGAMASIICALLRTPNKRIGVLHLDRGYMEEPFTEHELQFADAIAASVAAGLDTAQGLEQQRNQYLQSFTALARTVQARDQYAGDHTGRLTNYSLLLAEELKLSAQDKYHIQIGTPLYDIGKIGIDDAILRKPGKLTTGEYEEMKTHTVKGATMLDCLNHLGPMIPIVRHHHERWDGGGYPDGLAREQIPLTARIVAVADAFAAMTAHRPYRPAMPADQAFLELIGKAGTHFDPACVYAFVKARSKVENLTK